VPSVPAHACLSDARRVLEREHDVARVAEVVVAVLLGKAGDPVALVEDVVEVHD